MCAPKVIILLWIGLNISPINAARYDMNGVKTILAMENENITIQCETATPMAYCAFDHPTGNRYLFLGNTLDAGRCSINIVDSQGNIGDWCCYSGGKDSIGVEIIQYINLPIAGKFASLKNNVTTVVGKQVTLPCTATGGLMPLRYCRFKPPNEQPFSVASDVSYTKPVLVRYFYPKNKSMEPGDCAVTIREVMYKDIGTWTCGAKFYVGTAHNDSITVNVEGLHIMSSTSARNIIFGSIGVTCFLIILNITFYLKRSPQSRLPLFFYGRRIPDIIVVGPSEPSSPLPDVSVTSF